MSQSNILFSQVTVGRVLDRVVVRLLRHWFARNVNRGGQLMSLDLLFADEQSTVVHASIGVQHISAFQSRLKEGSLYVLSCFDVSRGKDKYRMCDFDMVLRLSTATKMIEISEHLPEIPKQVFRFRSYADLAALAKTSYEMPDVIGQICSTKAFHDGVTNALKKIILFVRLESGEQVRLTSYDSHAVAVLSALQTKEKDSCVVLATNVNPKFYAEMLYLNSTSATKFFFDDEVDETKLFFERVRKNSTVEKFIRVQKLETMSVAEINEYILLQEPQEIEFLCSAKITGIETKRGWNFISCASCGRKLKQEETSLVCSNCHATPVVGSVRYRVEIAVADDTAQAVFVVFNAAMEKITKTEASKLVAQMAEDEHGGDKSAIIPNTIMDLIGSTFTFQLRISHFNFSSYHESFTVSRVFVDGDQVPTPKFTPMESAIPILSGPQCVSVSEQHGPNGELVDSMNKKKQRLS